MKSHVADDSVSDSYADIARLVFLSHALGTLVVSVGRYIKQLAQVDPEQFSISVTSVDGG
jgi:glutaminase